MFEQKLRVITAGGKRHVRVLYVLCAVLCVLLVMVVYGVLRMRSFHGAQLERVRADVMRVLQRAEAVRREADAKDGVVRLQPAQFGTACTDRITRALKHARGGEARAVQYTIREGAREVVWDYRVRASAEQLLHVLKSVNEFVRDTPYVRIDVSSLVRTRSVAKGDAYALAMKVVYEKED